MNNDENYPESRKDGTVEEIFGVTVEDQYRWLEDFTSPESTAVDSGDVKSSSHLYWSSTVTPKISSTVPSFLDSG